jgi:hypothetical protein
MCDTPGFHLGSLTLTIGSNELTLVKRRSTWVITSTTSPTTPNDSYWSTLGQVGQNPSQNPLTTLWPSSVIGKFCRVLKISPKHFKISQCKSCVVCRGTQLSCWVAFKIWSAKLWKSLVNASGYYSLAPGKFASWHANCAQMVEENTI